jgi:hypothetical protein
MDPWIPVALSFLVASIAIVVAHWFSDRTISAQLEALRYEMRLALTEFRADLKRQP